MADFQLAHAQGDDWTTVAQACWQQLVANNTAFLGFLYVSDAWAAEYIDLVAWFKQRLPQVHWVGSVGLSLCATGVVYHETPAIVVLLADFAPSDFQVFNTISENLDHFHSQHKDWYQSQQSLFAVVHGDPRNAQINDLIQNFSKAVDNAFLVGGLTSARQTHWQLADRPTQGGLSGVLFSSKVAVMTRLTQGCYPIGDVHEITDCQNNIIMKINNRPALDVFFEAVGEQIQHDFFQIVGRIFIGLPIVGSDSDDYLIRPVLGIDPRNKFLAVADAVNVGSRLVFTHRHLSQAKAHMRAMLWEMKDHWPHPPKGGLYFSCLGRGGHLFDHNDYELKLIQKELGDFPLAGFFANGEIFHQNLYGYSGILTLFF
jgi:small ligand-binding sensory domain FIST